MRAIAVHLGGVDADASRPRGADHRRRKSEQPELGPYPAPAPASPGVGGSGRGISRCPPGPELRARVDAGELDAVAPRIAGPPSGARPPGVADSRSALVLDRPSVRSRGLGAELLFRGTRTEPLYRVLPSRPRPEFRVSSADAARSRLSADLAVDRRRILPRLRRPALLAVLPVFPDQTTHCPRRHVPRRPDLPDDPAMGRDPRRGRSRPPVLDLLSVRDRHFSR